MVDEKKQKSNIGAILGFIALIIGIALVLWNISLVERIVDIEKRSADYLTIDNQTYWNCIEWYGTCGKLVFDNQSGMYAPDGYFKPEECAGACAEYTLRKHRILPTITLPEEKP